MPDRKITYTVEEAAKIIGVSTSKLYRSVRAGELAGVQLGRRVVVPAVAIERLLGFPISGDAESGGRADNEVALTGRLTREPAIRTSRNGVLYATMRLAVGRAADAEALVVDIVAFGARATSSASLSVGQLVSIQGRLSQREWEADDGTRRRTQRIVADCVQPVQEHRKAAS